MASDPIVPANFHLAAAGAVAPRRLLLGLLLTVACAAATAQPAPNAGGAKLQLLDRVVAVVNKDVITQSQLEERVGLVTRQLNQQNVQLPERATLDHQVLERMIMDRAQLQLAEDSGIKIDDLQVDRAVDRIAEQNKLSLAQFRQALEHDGVSFDKLRDDIRTEITLARLREREVDSKIQVTDSEIDNYLADNTARKVRETANAEYDVSHILVRVPEGATPEQVETLHARATEAMKEARTGADFAKIAVTFSDAPDALQGGGLGWRTRDRLPDLFVGALDNMQPGDTSDVMRSPAGFHVIHLNDRRGVRQVSGDVEQTHARHILVRTNELVSDADAKRRIEQLRARIVQGEDFAELARLNSDDSSAPRGGDLGWLYPGDTVPDFEAALAKLKPQELSEPVRTPFGWHLIQVLERRRGDMSSDRQRLEARKAVRERKADEAFEEWLRELRDRTYTEYRLDDR
jgi:peptidyl-prolyl cis-trans isomerase SurA